MGTRKQKANNTAALVEGPSERLSLEETWPAEDINPVGPEDFPGTDEESHLVAQTSARDLSAIHPDSTAHPDNQRPFFDADEARPGTLGLSSDGPFVAPAEQLAAVSGKRPKQTVASMSRDLAFSKFRDSLFTLCFKFGFTLETAENAQIEAVDVSDAKGSAKRALAVASMADVELRK